jgi:hypothetical protein
MIYEMRTYHVVPSKMEAYGKQWAEVTHPLFLKYGFRVMGYWTEDVEGANDLFYILAWEDMEERNRQFDAFHADPEWVKVMEKNKAEGSSLTGMDHTFWRPTAFSPLQ